MWDEVYVGEEVVHPCEDDVCNLDQHGDEPESIHVIDRFIFQRITLWAIAEELGLIVPLFYPVWRAWDLKYVDNEVCYE